jgi:N utilization substance protein A
MMSKEFLAFAEALSNEKGVSKEIVLDAIQAALEVATKKLTPKDINVRVNIHPKTGEYETFRFWDIVEDDLLTYPDKELALSDAILRKPDAKIGEKIEEPIESVQFGRIAAQSARQVIAQKIREAEYMLIVNQFKERIGHLINGQVKKVTRDYIIIDLGGKAEAFLPRTEMLPHEMFRINDRIRTYLYDVSLSQRGPKILVSRIKNEMLTALFRIEVPEIGENIIEVKAVAREPSIRAKIAVKTNDGRIDPVGACVGMRGARVQAVSSELGGERVDIILWDDNPAQLVINAMAPAEISSIVVDEETNTMDLAVAEDMLSQAIGKNGQNVRLASQLTGWVLNVMTIAAFNEKTQEESTKNMNFFIDNLGIDADIATILVNNGFTSLEEVAYVPKEEFLAIEEFDEEIVEELQQRANDALLTKALSGESESNNQDDLNSLQGMSQRFIQKLNEHNINTLEGLAELAVDELVEYTGMTNEMAAKFIMKAREPWFK